MSYSDFVRIGAHATRQVTNSSESTVLEPIAYQLSELIGRAVGFSYEIIPSLDGPGHLLPSGHWTGMLGMLQRKEVDIVLVPLILTKERSEVFLFSYPYLYSEITFATRKLEYAADPAAILHPFSMQMWMAVILCLCTMPFLFHALLQKKYALMTLFMSTISSFLNQGMKFRPSRIREYFLLASWLLATGLVGYFYSAVLLSFLTFPSLTGVKTIEDLANGIRDGKYQASSYRGTTYSSLMLNSSDESLETIGLNLQNNNVYSDDFVDLLQDSTYEKKVAFILVKIFLVSYNEFYFISEDSFAFAYCGFPMSKYFCCKSKLNDVIHRFWSSGIFKKFYSDHYFKEFLKKLHKLTPPREKNDLKLTLADLKGTFLFLITSQLLAFFVLLIEIFISKFKPKIFTMNV